MDLGIEGEGVLRILRSVDFAIWQLRSKLNHIEQVFTSQVLPTLLSHYCLKSISYTVFPPHSSVIYEGV